MESKIKLKLIACTLIFGCSFFYSTSSYAQLAEGDCKFVGNIISNTIPSDYNEYWNQVTPENAGKWGSVESSRDNMNWTALDNAYNHAVDNGYPFKQHTFIWENQKPSWIDALSPEEQLEEIEEWIKLYGQRYPETDMIDVVNEPLHAAPSYKTAMGGSGESGYDWIIWAFEKARQYNPNATLLINDYNILKSYSNTSNYKRIIAALQERNLIDGIGVQGHFLETTANSVIKDNLDALAATGLPIYISEYDINLSSDSQQENKLKEQFPLIYQHPGVAGITFWGYQQGQIWRQDAYLVRSNGTERPALTWLRNYLTARCSGVLSSNHDLSRGDGLLQNAYPNPVRNGNLNLDVQENAEHIYITDFSGKSVFEKFLAPGEQKITLTLNLKAGIYIIKVTGREEWAVKKIIIE